MGCFLGCFGGRKDRNRPKPAKKPPPVNRINESYKPLEAHPSPKQLVPNLSPEKLASEAAAASLPELKLRENHEQGSFSSSRKKVTFDLNVRTYEEVIVHEHAENSPEEHERDEAAKEKGKQQDGEDNSSTKSVAFPLNHRYQNCASSYDEDEYGEEEEEEEEEEVSDLDEEDDDIGIIEGNEEESYDSYFSLPIGKGGQNIRPENGSGQEVDSPMPTNSFSPDREPTVLAKGNARDRSQYVHSVLNPVENLSKWKEVKVRAAPPTNPRKENIDLSQVENKMDLDSEPTFKAKKPQGSADSNPTPKCRTKQEVSVDASLSTWLVSSENSAKKGSQGSHSALLNSSVNREERPILGALTVEDIKQSSATSSPRRSPSRSPDEIPILGTVGSYWHSNSERATLGSSGSGSETKGIPNTTSKYSEDRRVKWHSTPFEVRLERALNKGAA